jgi:ornithine carbamoyltransferase
LLSIDDLSAAEIRFLLRLAAELKSAKLAGSEQQRLKGRNIALIFEKDSTRTRTGFEVAAYDQGAHVTYLGPSGSQIGHKESMKDTARVLGRMYDAIEFRGYSQQSARALAEFSGVPVYNGLTDEAHPTQALADFMTMREFTHKHLSDMTLVFMGTWATTLRGAWLSAPPSSGWKCGCAVRRSSGPNTHSWIGSGRP